MRLKKICDCDTCIKWQSSKQNNGEFNYWLFIQLIFLRDVTGDNKSPLYTVEIKCASPEQAGKEYIEQVTKPTDIPEYEYSDEQIADLLSEYGVAAVLYKADGNNKSVLLKQARNELKLIPMLFGFYMDKPENPIGSTGWDFIRGDIIAGLERMNK